MFFLNNKIIQIRLLRKLIAESKSVIEQAETYNNIPIVLRLVKCYSQFVIMVSDFLFFSPNRNPSFVKSGCLCIFDGETIKEIDLSVQFRLVNVLFCPFKISFLVGIFSFQLQTQCTWLNNGLAFICQFIYRCSLCIQRKMHFKVSVWRTQFMLCVDSYGTDK